MRATAAIAALLILGFGDALAQEAPKARLKVGVLAVKSSGTTDPKTFEGVSSLIANELARKRPNVDVVGAEDKSAQYIVVTEGIKFGATWVVNMSLLDVARSKAVARASRKTKKADKPVEACLEAVRELAPAIP